MYRLMNLVSNFIISEFSRIFNIVFLCFSYNFYLHLTGMTLSSCKMIETSNPGRLNIFNTVDQICFNGLNFNTYFLRHIVKKLKRRRNNLLMFSHLNIPHDAFGQRVQGIDHDLADFVNQMSQQENTITFMFADHGNTYNGYVYKEKDGRYEMHHPHFFTILPENVINKLDKNKLMALRTNRLRLVNHIDLHHTIKHLANKEHPEEGLFHIMPTNRTCGDLLLSTPNFCLCEDLQSPMVNETEYWPFVEFVVGHFNNEINDASPGGHCKRIVPTSFENINTKRHGDVIEVSLDVVTTPGLGSKNSEERFSFQMKYNSNKELKTFEAEYIIYSRVTRYGIYSECSDTDPKKLKLCVCDMNNKMGNLTKQTSLRDLSPSRNAHDYKIKRNDFFLYESISHLVEGHLGLLKREVYKKDDKRYSVTFELINYSQTKTYEVLITFSHSDYLKPLQKEECKGIVKPQSMRYLCTVSRSEDKGNEKLKFESHYKLLD